MSSSPSLWSSEPHFHDVLNPAELVYRMFLREYKLLVRADLRGIDPKDVEVTIDSTALTLTGNTTIRRLSFAYRKSLPARANTALRVLG
jgi:HSP20 family molecular chaperone IbpA